MPIFRQESKRLFVYLTCVYILTWYLQLGNRVGMLGAIRFEFLLGFVLSLGALLTYFSEPQKHTPLLKPVLFFLGILTLYTLFSHDFSFSWNVYFNRVVKFAMLAMCHLLWIASCTAGALIGGMLPVDFAGIEFSATALFVAVVVNQWREAASHVPALVGLASALLFYLLLGPDQMILPALSASVVALALLKDRIAMRKPEANDEC